MEVALTIPVIRDELLILAKQVAAYMPDVGARIAQLAEATKRRQSTLPRAPNSSRPITDDIASQIKELKTAHPTWSNRTIAEVIGDIDGGRVSEVLSGKRDGS